MYRFAQAGIIVGFLLTLSALFLREIGLGPLALVYGLLFMAAGTFGCWAIRRLRH